MSVLSEGLFLRLSRLSSIDVFGDLDLVFHDPRAPLRHIAGEDQIERLVLALHVTGAGRKTPIYIGQGWQGKPVDGLGVGRCASCASMNIPGCPPTAEAIAAYLTENNL